MSSSAVSGTARQERIRSALASHPLYFILDETLCTERTAAVLAGEALAAGVKMLQTRFKSIDLGSYLELARHLRKLCTDNGCLLIINDQLDLALQSAADGIHVGSQDMAVADIRALDNNLIIGRSVRTVEDALQAQADGADYIGSGAVFASTTKQTAAVIGIAGISAISSAISIPLVGIGGINVGNCSDVLASGAAGFCSIAPFLACQDIGNLVLQFKTGSVQTGNVEGSRC